MIDENKREMYALIETHYRTNSERLVKIYTRFLKSKERAEDVIQEAYTRALQYCDTYDKERPLDKWFNAIIASAVRDNKRSENLKGMVDIKEAAEIPVKPAAIPTIILNQVMRRIDTKGDEIANILRLTLLHHYRPTEISKLVNMSANNIRQIVFKFREEIRQDYKWSL